MSPKTKKGEFVRVLELRFWGRESDADQVRGVGIEFDRVTWKMIGDSNQCGHCLILKPSLTIQIAFRGVERERGK